MIRRALLQFLALLALASGPAAISAYRELTWRSAQSDLEPGEVRAATARMWGEDVLWIDARSRRDFDAAHIPEAALLNAPEWNARVADFLKRWNPDKTIVVYGGGGIRDEAPAVANRLREELQLDGVYVLKGGWPAWQRK